MREENLLCERLSLLLGTIMGAISQILNEISASKENDKIYHSLLDLQRMAALQINELYYKREIKE